MDGRDLSLDIRVKARSFSGVSLANNSANISLLQYADDVLFFGEWSKSNATNLTHLLECYHEVSGLKVNFSKSCLYGVGVPYLDVVSLARYIKCSHDSLPFMYLGLPVGKDMRKSVNWNGVIDRFSKKLSTWKANMLSIGGRLTLVKSVLENLPIYFLSLFRAPASVIKKMESIRMRFFWEVNANERKIIWIRWEQIMLDIKNGGLGIGSIKEKNMSLLGKWKSRFLSEPHALWNKCIKTINGYNGGFDSGLGSGSCLGVWDNIIRCCNEMMEKFHINLDNLMMKKVNSGNQTQFWTDSWISGDLYTLENLINGLSLNASVADKWIWSSDAVGIFTVKSLSNLIQNRLIGGGRIDVPFKWNLWVPRKVNIYAWRLAMNRLPTKDKLTRQLAGKVTPLGRRPLTIAYNINDDTKITNKEAAIGSYIVTEIEAIKEGEQMNIDDDQDIKLKAKILVSLAVPKMSLASLIFTYFS
ncbi:hypothetical protein Tco_0512398 [Tanacetum coccineum]